ncbi:hypothetical protein HMPREF3037_02023 [Candidatus Stoquefichus sp. KLE1796]|nr:hypothetical protein HMPREF3037_02023 [Candidatus Stoquefichus sp. KLE1796]
MIKTCLDSLLFWKLLSKKIANKINYDKKMKVISKSLPKIAGIMK